MEEQAHGEPVLDNEVTISSVFEVEQPVPEQVSDPQQIIQEIAETPDLKRLSSFHQQMFRVAVATAQRTEKGQHFTARAYEKKRKKEKLARKHRARNRG